MKLSEVAIRRPISTIMFFAAIVLLGLVAFEKLPMQILPDVSPPYGAAYVFMQQEMSPEELERKLIEPMEGEIAQLPNVKTIRVNSRGGRGAFFPIEFEYGTNVNYRIVDLQEKLDRFRREFPRGQVRVNAFAFNTSWVNQEYMELELKGPRSDPFVEGIDVERVRQRLQNIDGVAEADIWGGRERTVDVQILQDRLREFGVSMFQVINEVQSHANEPVFLGDIEEGSRKYYVRLNGQFNDTSEVEDVMVKEDGNIAVRHLGIAEDTYRARRMLRRYDGQPSIGMELNKEATVNVLDLTDRTLAVVDDINSEMPDGYELKVEWKQADEIRTLLNTLTELAMIGVLLSMVILYLFIRNIRMTMIICVVIPISVIATFNFMYFSDISINMLTLVGLAVGVGTLIDSSIVVLENIFRHHELGKNAVSSSLMGSKEVGLAVFALTLTNVVVFLPVVFVEGQIRMMFTEGALAIIYPMLISMLVALTLVPMATSKILQYSDRVAAVRAAYPDRMGGIARLAQPLKQMGGKVASFFPFLTMTYMKRQYGTILKGCLRHRVRFLLAIVLLVLYTYFYTMSDVNRNVLQEPEDDNYFEVYVYAPPGTQQDHTVEIVSRVEDIILDNVPEREHTSSRIEDDFAEIRVRLKDERERERSSPTIKEDLRPLFDALGDAEVTFTYTRSRGDSMETPVDTGRGGIVEIRGPEYEQINLIAQVLIEQMQLIPNVRDVQSETEAGPLEVHFTLDRDASAHLQITPQAVAQSVQVAQRRGDFSTVEMKKGDQEIQIVFSQLEKPEDFRIGQEMTNNDEGLAFEELLDIPVFSPALAGTVTLKELGSFEIRRGMGMVQRENRERIGRIHYSTTPNSNYSEIEQAIETLIENYPAMAGYRISLGGRSRQIDEILVALNQIVMLAFILVYMCIASLFESFSLPFVILFSIPLAVIGIVWSFILTDSQFTEMAGMGLIVLIGMLPNSAILLVHFAGYLRREKNFPRVRAIMKSGYSRLRPIFMTVLTTNLGVLPMAFGDEQWSPFAITVIGGLTSSTILTLLVVPGFYFIVEDTSELFKRFFRYCTSWRWVLVFWNSEKRAQYRQELTAYRQKEVKPEPLEVLVEYLVRIYPVPLLERAAKWWQGLFQATRVLSPVPGFVPNAALSASHVSTEARKKALDGITMSIEPGIFGLLGPNGAGKTTLLRLLSGIDQPTRGFLSVCGHDMKTEAHEAQQCIGYLPQDFGVYSHMTAAQYLDYFALLKGIRRKKDRKKAVADALEMVNLTDQKDVPVGQFSGGMMRRVGLAQIFVKPPKVLIVDEPTVGLDPMERVRFRNLLSKLSRDRVVILSTHIVEDIAHSCQKLAVMDKGNILFQGNASELTATVQGKVWEVMAPNQDSWQQFKRRFKVVGQSHTSEGILLRIVSDQRPDVDAVTVEPTLEDAYIYHISVNQAKAN